MRFKRLTGQNGLKQLGLEPRAAAALAVIALGLFLTISLAKYGGAGAAEAGEVSWHVAFAGWFVEVFGAGAWLLVLLPTIWGVIVYFREETPNLAIRAVGVLVLACATAMITGLLQGADPGPWAGSVGAFAVWLSEMLAKPFGTAVSAAFVWTGTIVMFVTSLIWATDWMFHSVRRPNDLPLTLGVRHVALEPLAVALREPGEATDERELIRAAAPPSDVTAAVYAAGTTRGETEDDVTGLPSALTADASVPDVTDFVQIDLGEQFDVSAVGGESGRTLPRGYSTTEDDGRVVVQGPTGYQGVEFLPPSDDLLAPEPPPEDAYDVSSIFAADIVLETPAAEPVAAEEPVAEEPVAEEPVAAEPADEPVVAAAPEPEPPGVELIDELVPLVPTPEVPSPAPPVFAEPEPTTASAPEPEPEPDVRRASGIGLPGEGAFVDEVYTTTAATDLAPEAPGDGAASHEEVAAAYGNTPPVSSSLPETVTSAEMLPPAEAAVTPVVSVDDDGMPPPAARLERLNAMRLDPLFGAAVSAVFDGGRGSPMVLQRRLGIGHGRGLRILAQMAEAGLVGPEDPTGSRALRVSRSDWEAFVGSHQL